MGGALLEYDPTERRTIGAFTERLLANLPELWPRYETTAAGCRDEGIGEAAPETFLYELALDLLDSYRADPAGGRATLADLARYWRTSTEPSATSTGISTPASLCCSCRR